MTKYPVCVIFAHVDAYIQNVRRQKKKTASASAMGKNSGEREREKKVENITFSKLALKFLSRARADDFSSPSIETLSCG